MKMQIRRIFINWFWVSNLSDTECDYIFQITHGYNRVEEVEAANQKQNQLFLPTTNKPQIRSVKKTKPVALDVYGVM